LYENDIDENDKPIIKRLANTNKLKNRIWLFFNLKCGFGLIMKAKMIFNKY